MYVGPDFDQTKRCWIDTFIRSDPNDLSSYYVYDSILSSSKVHKCDINNINFTDVCLPVVYVYKKTS